MARNSGNKSSGNVISAAEKQALALDLRKSGHTYESIAAKVGYASASGAEKAVKTALRRTIQEPADELRALEVERMDALLLGLWPKATAGDPRSVEVAVKVLERRAKLLGLDAAIKINVKQIVEETAAQHGLDESETVELLTSVEQFLAASKAGT